MTTPALCPHCGAERPDVALLCAACGGVLGRPVRLSLPQWGRRTWLFIAVGGAWIASLAVAIAWIAHLHGPQRSPVAHAILATPACLTVVGESAWPSVASQGSGFVLTQDGRCVTNHHVLRAMFDGMVTLGDGRSYSISKVETYDEDLDLAVFQIGRWTRDGRLISPTGLPTVKLASGTPRVGERVATISSPVGLTTTMGEGMVSAIRVLDGLTAIQISMPVSGGSSGGPVFDGDGRVMAVIRSHVPAGENLAFAVPADSLRRLLDRPAPIPIGTFGLLTALRDPEPSDPPEVLAAVARGNQALRDGRPERAMSEYRAALEARPDAPAALLNAALCARLLGDGTSGRRLLERLLPLLDEEDDDRWWVEQVLEE